MPFPIRIGRRALLAGAAAGVAASLLPSHLLRASSPGQERRFVLLFFAGGWDVLLGADARDPAKSYGPELNLGTELLSSRYKTPLEVSVGGSPTLWGAPMASLVRHADVATIFRGVNMNNVAHPNGRAYANTFVQPAGQSPRGDSIGVRMSTSGAMSDVVPSLSVGVPSYNPTLGPSYSALSVSDGREIYRMLQPNAREIDAYSQQLLAQARQASGSCLGPAYQGVRLDEHLHQAREQVEELRARDLARQFDLASNEALNRRYGYGVLGDFMGNPRALAALTYQAIATGLTSTVVTQLVRNVDDHADWANRHPQSLTAGFDAMALLLDDLRQDDPGLERTTVVATSEFARTPQINGSRGRDHWFANVVMVFGGGLVPGVFGETVEDTLGLKKISLATGKGDDTGVVLRPEHVGATLAAACGIDASAFRADVIEHMIKGGL